MSNNNRRAQRASSSHFEPSGVGRRWWPRIGYAAPFLSLVGLGACGVEEHLHELEVTAQGGSTFRPPPLMTGGTSVGNGGAATGGASGNPATTGGVPTAAGGVPTATGGVPTANGGVPNAGGSSGQNSAGTATTSGGSSGGVMNATGGAPVAGGPATVTGGAPNASGGASGATVDINGTVLPKENVIAFIHFGHSNMAGRASGPSASRAYHFTDQNLYAWVYRNKSWEPALEPKTAGDADSSPAGRQPLGGPGTALLKEAAALSPNHYFVSLGFGKGSAYCSQFEPGGLYYDQVMQSALQLKGKVTFAAIVIMLGITERHGTADDINGYPNCINKIVTQIRTDLAEPNLPLLIQDYEAGATGDELSPTGTFAQQIIPQIRKIPSVVSNSALVPTDGLAMQDDHHFNLDGHREYVKRLLSIMKDKGWFPW